MRIVFTSGLLLAGCFAGCLAATSPLGIESRSWNDSPRFGAEALPVLPADKLGSFRTSESGEQYLTIRFLNEGSAAARLRIRNMHLPSGAKLFVYGVTNGEVTGFAGPYEGAGDTVDPEFWTAVLRGSEIVVELQAGDNEFADLPFEIMELSPANAAEADIAIPVKELRTSEFRGQTLQHIVSEGKAIYQGDILLDDDQLFPVDAATSKSNTRSAVAISGSRYRWPNGTIPYDVDETISNQGRITEAIRHWNTYLAGSIRLIPRTVESAFIRFVPSPSAGQCASSVGMTGHAQSIWAGDSCSTGNMIHEIGHAVGLWHEQGREDRDRFVTINWDNIIPSASSNFTQNILNGDDINNYDPGSIMHYGAYAFTVNGLPTIDTNPAGISIGQRSGLSPGDIAAVRSMYPVTGVTSPATAPAQALATVPVSILSNPANLPFMADGVAYGSQKVFNWVPGSMHTISAGTLAPANNSRNTFQYWSDGGAQTHTIVTPSGGGMYLAAYSTGYRVTVNASGQGTASISPVSSDGFYPANATIQITAQASAGFCFTGWSGLLPGAPQQAALSVSKPYAVTAQFLPGIVDLAWKAMSLPPYSGIYTVPVNALPGCMWTMRSSASWVRVISSPPANGGLGNVRFITSLNSGSARSATIAVGSAVLTVTQAAGR